MLQRRRVKALFIFEVVVEQRLVYPSAPRDLIGARARRTFMRKLFQSSLQDGGTGLLRLATGTGTSGLGIDRHLIN